jgi:hypothetical protein
MKSGEARDLAKVFSRDTAGVRAAAARSHSLRHEAHTTSCSNCGLGRMALDFHAMSGEGCRQIPSRGQPEGLTTCRS